MKPISLISAITLFCSIFLCSTIHAQAFGTSASAVWITNCNQDNYFNTTGTIGPAGNAFANTDFGSYTRNSGTFILRGAEVRTFKAPGIANVCSVRMYYRIYPQSGVPGSFNIIDLPLADNCDIPSSTFASGGSCVDGDQKWNRVTPDGATSPYAPVDLTAFGAGQYVLEVYYDVSGSSTSTSLCNETVTLNNGGNNYKATYSIQAPSLSSSNPTSCDGSEGKITISGLTPGATYDISYTDDNVPVAPATMTANGSGQVLISGLKAGTYADFILSINGCTTNLSTGLVLSNPLISPKFNKINSFCAGSTPPVLTTTSLNGLTGMWSPAVIDNQNSGSYTFTPNAGQCGLNLTINVTVIQKTVPTFSFGTSLSVCSGASVPALPGTSTNGISGTWSPSAVDNMNSGTYTFTPNAGQCATATTLTVKVNPTINPTFSFGTSTTFCAGSTAPVLPTTSTNGVAGTWSPSVVDNQNSGTYTFTPNAGQCATTTTFTVTVNPNVTPVFSFGTSAAFCVGSTVPSLPSTSNNGITGIWNPATVDNQNSGTYTFTPTAGQCATTATFTVTVTPNATPTFAFGNSATICAGASVPSLPNTSNNGITGTWSPSTVDNQNSDTYTFTPDAGQCATTATYTVTVNPNVTPAFSFGTTLTTCAEASVPALPTTSTNGITGTWSPSTIDNQNSGSYTFTPSAGQCAASTSLTVTINPNTNPVFSFGTTLTICAGSAVPSLPSTSDNGVNGTWSPSTVDNQNSGNYTFTPTAGQCATSTTFTVTVNPNITPSFSFGTSLTICAGSSVPTLQTTSTNGITGTWNPSTIDNQKSGTYTFTPAGGQCAVTTNLNVTVNPILTPTFSFGTSATICQGTAVPTLVTTSTNGITGTWSPASVDNQNSGTYTFTPAPGQCALPTTFDVTVNPSIIPTFSFGTTLTICAGSAVPSLPTTSDNGYTGSWSPAIVSNQNSAVYTFTPDPVAGQCLVNTTFTVTVNQILTPTFNFGTAFNVCSGKTPPVLPTTSSNGITGVWNPATIDNQNSGSYTFTTNPGQCADPSATIVVTVVTTPTVSVESDTTVVDGSIMPTNVLNGTPAGVNYNWTNSNTGIGLSASGSGNIPSFTATNKGNSNIKGTITITPVYNGCSGSSVNYVVTVIPLDKDVFVPNVFSPNGDGKNDILFVYGNYISKVEMRIFNQWGQQIYVINDIHQGWDGKYKGSPQPVGVYAYSLKAVMTDGRNVQLKGSITLVR